MSSDSERKAGSTSPLDSIFGDHQNTGEPVDLGNQQRSFSNLCLHCQGLIKELLQGIIEKRWQMFTKWVDREFYESFDALRESAFAGCAFCDELFQDYEMSQQLQLWDHAPMEDLGDPVKARDGKVEVGISLSNECFTLRVSMGQGANRRRCKVKLFPTSSTSMTTNSHRHILNPLWTKPSTRGCLPLLGKWLESCCRLHEKCRRRSEAPSRLIFVGNGQTRLELNTSPDDCTRYVTLSHCWGKTKFEILTSQNIDEFARQIPASALSRTFQDAIFVTRVLKIDWLWIDSLCIIQDSAVDWEIESAKMAGVYGGATLNIAAANSADGNGGLFFDRKAHWQCQIQLNLGDKKVGYSCIAEHAHEVSVRRSVLASRAWTLQERLLPARTVFFTKNQAFWECQEREACELFPTQTPEELHMFDESGMKGVQRSDWQRIVEIYSKTKLTYPSDKLVAISGLARAIQNQTGDEYVAGLWRSSLLCDLCWRIYGVPSENLSAPIPYRAPSWSWASLDHELFSNLRMDDNLQAVLAEIISVNVTQNSGDSLGAIKHANLRISSGFLIHVALVESKNDGDNSDWILVAGEVEQQLIAYKSDIHMDRWGQQLSNIWLFSLCKYGGWVFGLVLEPSGETGGQYKRVGLFNWVDEDFQRVRETFSRGGCLPREVDCLSITRDNEGGKKYAIELV